MDEALDVSHFCIPFPPRGPSGHLCPRHLAHPYLSKSLFERSGLERLGRLASGL